MSDIDKRVVQMEFDNSKFDKNVKKSSNTLSKFEEQLKFKDVEYSLNAVKKGFSSFEIAAITAVSRITNAVITLGTKIVKSLSIDQISDGWKKFGDKTIAVATLAAQKIVIAGKELENYEDKLEGITDQLEKLEWFTNETSYTFNDMVAALGKFTAAGQDLDKSVNAMEGIATWAAMSGANAQKASAAMTQLAQTLGRGYVLRIDWQSIQTLNMDTAMFREKVLETATELGKLKKVGNDFISNTGKKITSVNFTETLASKWFTSDVLVKTLEKYSAAVEDIYELSERDGISARAAIEKYGDTLDEFAVKAFKAAQETRTLGEALVYVFSTIGSTWSKTFEKIVGGYDEAKTLWSDLSDALYDDVIAANDFRNEILGVWSDLEGRSDLFAHGDSKQGAFWNIYDSIIAIKKIFKDAKEAVFPKSTFESEADQAQELGLRFKAFTESLRNTTAQTLKNIQNDTKFINILKGLYTVIKILMATLAGVWNVVSPIVDVAKDLIDNVFSRLSILGNKLSKMDGIIEAIANTSEELRSIVISILDIIDPEGILNSIIGFARDIFAIIKDIKPFEALKDLVTNFFTTLNESGGSAENFKRIAQGIASVISMLVKVLKQIINLVNKYVVPLIIKVLDFLGKITATVLGVITEALAVVADFFTALNQLLEGNTGSLSKFGETVISFLKSIPSKLKLLQPILLKLLDILKALIDIILLIPKILNDISISLSGRGIVDNIKALFDGISNALKNFGTKIRTATPEEAKKIFSPIINLFSAIGNFLSGIISIIRPIINIISQIIRAMGDVLKSIGKFLDTFVDDQNQNNDKIIKAIAIAAVAIGAIVALTFMFTWIRDGIMGLLFPIKYIAETASEGLYNLGASMKIRAIGAMLLDIASAFLLFSISVDILGRTADKGNLGKGIGTLLSFIVVIGTFALLAVKLNKSVGKAEKHFSITKKGLVKSKSSSITALDSVVDFIKAMSTALIKIAIALKLVAGIKKDDEIWKAFGILMSFVGALLVFTGLIKTLDTIAIIFGKKGANATDSLEPLANIVGSMSGLILKFAISIWILTSILKKNEKTTWKAFGMISSFLGLLVGMVLLIEAINVASYKITKKKKDLKGSGDAIQGLANVLKQLGKSLLLFSVSLAIITVIAKKDTTSMWKAFGIIAAFMAGIAGIIVSVTLTGGKMKKSGEAVEFLAEIIKKISRSMLLLVISITTLSLLLSSEKIDPKMMWKAFGVIAGMLATLAGLIVAVNLTAGKNKNADKALGKLGLIIGMLSLFMVSFGGAMLMISKMSIGTLITGIVGLAGLIILVDVLLNRIAKITKSLSKDKLEQLQKIILKTLIPMSVLLVSFGISMLIISKIPWLTILVATASIAGLMATLVGLSKIVNVEQMSKLALAMLIISPALIIFSLALANMQKINLSQVALQLLLIVGALSAFGILGKFLGEGMLIAAVAALTLAGSLLVLSVALALLSTFFVEFCTQVNDNAEVIKNAILVLAGGLVTAFVEMIQGILRSIIEIMPLIVEAIKSIVLGICKVIIDTAPSIFEAIKVIVLGILQLFTDIMPKFFEFLTEFTKKLLKYLIEVMPQFLTWLSQLLFGLLQIIIDTMPKFFEMLSVLIEGILKLIRDTAPDLFDSIIGILDAIISRTPELVSKIIQWIIEIITAIAVQIPVLFLGILDAIIKGLEKTIETMQEFKEKFQEIGRLLMEGLKKGIEDSTVFGKIIGAVKNVGNKIVNGFKNIFGIHSPSKVFAELGGYMMEGLALGISDNADKANDELEDASKNLTNTISQVSDHISNDLNSDDMTIRPVLDLSNVDKGVDSIKSLMSGISGDSSLSVSGNIAAKTSRAMERRNSESVAGSGNQNVVNNEGDNYYSTFNIRTDNPEEFAKEADKILQKLRLRANLAKGGAR